MDRIPGFLALASLISGIITFVIGWRVGHDAAEVSTLIYAGFTTLILQSLACALTFVHARLLRDELAELGGMLAAAEEKGADSTTAEKEGH